MGASRKWWEKKWYWIFCILFTFFGVLALDAIMFPEQPLGRSFFHAIALSLGVLLAYFAYTKNPLFKIQPKTLRRIITIMGGVSIGLMIWGIVVLPLDLHFQFSHPVIVILLGVALVLIFALILDTLGKRRNHEPLIYGGGNI